MVILSKVAGSWKSSRTVNEHLGVFFKDHQNLFLSNLPLVAPFVVNFNNQKPPLSGVLQKRFFQKTFLQYVFSLPTYNL